MAKESTRRLLEKLKERIVDILDNPPLDMDGNEIAIGPRDLSALVQSVVQISKLEKEDEKDEKPSDGGLTNIATGYFPQMPIKKSA